VANSKNKRKGSLLSKALGFLQKKENKNNWYNDTFPNHYFRTYLQTANKPVWMARDYNKFADEAYTKNVVAFRSINLISQSASGVCWILSKDEEIIKSHPILNILSKPNPSCLGTELIEAISSYRMISGNAFILAVKPDGVEPKELFILRPDRVSIIPGKNGLPVSYKYAIGKEVRTFPVDRITGRSDILHIKNFHPLDDIYGMSQIEPAAYSIDQHNNSAVWNQALLQNGAKPSGALVVKMANDGSGGVLSDEQFNRIRNQVDEQYSGASNAGRPLLLEGGLEWKEMSLSPKDMDFIQSKHSSARDIALAFGVPPQLLGIPGDNTYSNLVEARLALWEQTILPLLDSITNALNNWLTPAFGKGLKLDYDKDKISALSPRRENVWNRVKDADFMTDNEKREAVGMKALEGEK